MRIGCAILCLCLGWPLAGRGEDLKSAGDVTNITAYLEGKFGIPAPPGSNDLVAADGQVYRNVQVWKNEPDGLTIRHDGGLVRLEFPLLPEDWQKKYGYDPEMAEDYKRTVAAALQEAEQAQQMLREQIRTSRP